MKPITGRSGPQPDDEEPDDNLGPSKTSLKAQDQALQELGVALAKLPPSRLAALDLPEDLRAAIADYHSIRAHGASKRHRKYLGRLLRGLDTEAYEKAVENFAAGSKAEARALHQVERWREELVADDEALARWLAEHPGTDVQHLRSLIRAARKHDAGTAPSERRGKAWRELFKFIRQYLADA
ncbi:MAG: ribosome biogenesis factor YjgA [Wenzhouxiangellaceae bacterium]|nr:ribosome biogenesis factor YjgA [Wenzhouxiangellaceae bacterium]